MRANLWIHTKNEEQWKLEPNKNQLVNDLLEQHFSPLKSFDQPPKDINKITEPYIEVFKPKRSNLATQGVSETIETMYPTGLKPQATFGAKKPLPKGKK